MALSLNGISKMLHVCFRFLGEGDFQLLLNIDSSSLVFVMFDFISDVSWLPSFVIVLYDLLICTFKWAALTIRSEFHTRLNRRYSIERVENQTLVHFESITFSLIKSEKGNMEWTFFWQKPKVKIEVLYLRKHFCCFYSVLYVYTSYIQKIRFMCGHSKYIYFLHNVNEISVHEEVRINEFCCYGK